MTRLTRRQRWLLLAILLLAFGVRVYALNGQSMWSDEGLSHFRAGLSLREIASNQIVVDGVATTDTNPPFYFFLLHSLRALAGESIFALRFLGVLAGAASVALLFQVTRLLFDRRVAFAAALLLAISPLHVWQSQDMRNYSLLILLNLLSVYGLYRFMLSGRGWRDWRRVKWIVVWAISGLVAIYTHYFGFFVLAYGMLVLLWGIARQVGRRVPRRLLFVGLGLLLLLLPIIPVALARFRAGQQVDFVFVGPNVLLTHALSAFSLGIVPGILAPWWRVLPAVVLAVLGVAAFWLARRRISLALVLGYLFVPLGILALLSYINPLYNGPRHLLIGLPPFLILVAAGAVGLPRGWPRPLRGGALLLGGLLLVSQGQWLAVQFHDPALIKDDVRGAAAYLEDVVLPGDVVVLHDTLIGFTFDAYYDGAWTALPRAGQGDETAVVAELEALGAGANRVWFLTEPQPRTGFDRTILSNWANAHWPKLLERRFPALWLGVKLEAFVPQPAVTGPLPETAVARSATFGDELTLLGYESPAVVQAGTIWQPTLYWSAADTADAYTLSLRLKDAGGNIWAQTDRELWRRYPPDDWPAATPIRQMEPIALPAGVPPGSYSVWLRVLREPSGEELPTADGQLDLLLMPELHVTPATVPEGLAFLPEMRPLNVGFGSDIRLLGVTLEDVAYKPGHVAFIDLYWLAEETPPLDYALRLQMLAGDGTVLNEMTTTPTRGDYQTSRWQSNELLRGQVWFPIPATAEAGQLTIRAALIDPETGAPLPTGFLTLGSHVDLGQVTVEPWPLETTFPPIAVPFTAEFGDPAIIQLAGYELAPETAVAGETLLLTLYWRALQTTPQNYDVFVHLVDAQDQIVAQGDGPPLNGFRTTASWRPNEAFVDEHRILVPPEVAPGTYRLWVGFYNRDTGERLPAVVDGETIPGGNVVLQEVTVE